MIIVCGTDFSAASDAASLVAAKLAGELRARLHVVSVVPPAVDHAPLAHTLAVDGDELRSTAPNIAGFQTTVVRADDAATSLLLHAARVRADLVVVGARGASVTTDRLGRVAERVVADSDVPVLIVQDAAPLLRWLDEKERLRVLVTAALKPSEEGAMDFVARLREVAPCDVTALHVVESGESLSRDALLAALQRHVGAVAATDGVSFVVDETLARVDDRILDTAGERRASLIVLGSQRRAGVAHFFHASVAGSVLRHAATNVLVAPETRARGARLAAPLDEALVAHAKDAAASPTGRIAAAIGIGCKP
jgi:nucleotide-binding universal stress UspA family protein